MVVQGEVCLTKYGHINANMFGFNHLVVAVDKSQQSESNGSGSKTHKSQGPRLMALNIDKSPGAKHDGWTLSSLPLISLSLSLSLSLNHLWVLFLPVSE